MREMFLLQGPRLVLPPPSGCCLETGPSLASPHEAGVPGWSQRRAAWRFGTEKGRQRCSAPGKLFQAQHGGWSKKYAHLGLTQLLLIKRFIQTLCRIQARVGMTLSGVGLRGQMAAQQVLEGRPPAGRSRVQDWAFLPTSSLHHELGRAQP